MSKDKPINAVPVDIFKQAANETISRSITITETKLDKMDKRLKKVGTVKTWKELKKAIDGDHAERFNDVLHSLPDRDFVAAYLKSLEFFRPKVLRETTKKPTELDTSIEIVVNRGNPG